MTGENRHMRALLILTLARIPLALAALVYLLLTPYTTVAVAVATGLFALIELADFLDGLLARRLRLTSELGATLDPYADSIARLLVYTALAGDGLALFAVPVCMALRDVTVAYARVLTVRAGQSASARISGKLKAWVQGAGAFVLLLAPALWPSQAGSLMPYLSWGIALVTLASAGEYVAGAVRAVNLN
ncbi:MAG: CDP-diacylglycerol--glycerol-3-phosphate 3-phosphatidyltransferase [Calditrichaeota bacterium]|nr:CDP-diacylglycerol--glycerol-3-phosphate 3-phosphatidyltransferase [Calditrichota bacterium]